MDSALAGALQPEVVTGRQKCPLYGMSSVGFLIFDGLWREISARVNRFVRSGSGRTAEKRRNLARSKMRGFLSVRRVLQEDRDVEKYLGIQRPLDPSRVNSLSEYVNFKDASFPTSVIVAIDEEYASFDEASPTMSVRNYREYEEKPSVNLGKIAKVRNRSHPT